MIYVKAIFVLFNEFIIELKGFTYVENGIDVHRVCCA